MKTKPEYIQYLRNNRHLSDEELAVNVDMKQNTIRRYMLKFVEEDKAERLKFLHRRAIGLF